MSRGALPLVLLLAAVQAGARTAAAQTPDAPPASPAASADRVLGPSGPAPSSGVFPALGSELGRYGRDSVGLLTAPLSWNRADREKAAAFAVMLGGLFAADRAIDRRAQSYRSPATNRVSGATSTFGAEGGFGVSAALVVAGLAFHSPGLRDTGRDAIEAAIVAGLLDDVVKKAAGRERPNRSNGQTVFEPGSSNVSFASGHTTVAFAVASVIAARSSGWIVPGLAYAAATIVGLDRINDRAHFASDVFTGAVLGTVTGRWLVHRHRDEAGDGREATIELVPIGRGLGASIRF
ncbi:MAG TPA: phosphatase PAP2 family protein [Thermoanaerobaculia bacterium]|nr:phosphatase PAP2 family protein [Thermoanaerobaculia bacterium]